MVVLAAIALYIDLLSGTANSFAVLYTTNRDVLAFVDTASLQAFLSWAKSALSPVQYSMSIGLFATLPYWFLPGVVGTWAGWRPLVRFGRRGLRQQCARLAGLFLTWAGLAIVALDLSRIAPPFDGFSHLSSGDYLLSLPALGWRQVTITLQELGGIWDFVVLPILRLPLWLFVSATGFILLNLSRPKAISAIGDSASNATTDQEDELDFSSSSTGPELAAALSRCRGAFINIGIFSCLINILMLTGAFFMLQVYDRVLPSRSLETLIALSILALGLFAANGALDAIRGRMLVRIGQSLDQSVSPRAFDVLLRLPLIMRSNGESIEPVRDLDTVRGFLSSSAPAIFFDFLWLPIYLAIIFLLHPMIGWTACAGAMVLILLTLATEALTRKPLHDAIRFAQARARLAESARQNAEAVVAMGMSERLAERWNRSNEGYLNHQIAAGSISGDLGASAKTIRLILQSAVLGIGAYFVIKGEATAGIIIAGAILVSRALAPVDQMIGNWKSFVAARHSWHRLQQTLTAIPVEASQLTLPPATQRLDLEQVSAVPPGDQRVILRDISLSLVAGQGLGVIGPSASGKSTLARLLVGVWRPARGRVMLDGAPLEQWSSSERGQNIGYVPQDVELFAGTVAENIARFDPDATPNEVIAAAQAAGIHELVLSLPKGYETDVGDQGQALSAGQRQRVALARALFRDPFLVVLDEPNANLDNEGDEALARAIEKVRQRNAIAVVIAHRPSTLASIDAVIALRDGQIIASGPRDDVLGQFLRVNHPIRPHVRIVGQGED